MSIPAPASQPRDEQEAAHASEGARDVRTAIRNGLKLGASLMATWSVALFMRLLLPRYLGPERFGELNFADSFAGTYFVFLGLGIDTYVSKELPVRPDRANDFFGGVMVLRFALSGVLTLALAATLILTHRSTEIRTMVIIFAVGQLFMSINSTLAGMMQAKTNVGGLAIMNVTAKVIWGAGIVAALIAKTPLIVLAVPLAVSEAVKAAVLYHLVRQAYDLRIRIDLAALKMVVVASLPFYLNMIVVTLNAKLDVTLLEFLTHGDHESVGWYSAAQNIAGLAMMISPVLLWVVMPLMSRARARSPEELWQIIRRSIEGIYVVTLPVILMIWLGADFWTTWIFGDAYAPAAMSLRALAPILMLTYLAMLLSMTLVVLERSWMLTTVSSIGLVVNIASTVTLVPLCAKWIGPGGAGVGDALGVVTMELVVSTMLLGALGKQAIDKRIPIVVGKSLVVCGGVVATHFLLARIGPWRLVVDCVVYVALALLVGVPSRAEIMAIVQLVRERRAGKGQAAA